MLGAMYYTRRTIRTVRLHAYIFLLLIVVHIGVSMDVDMDDDMDNDIDDGRKMVNESIGMMMSIWV